MNKSQHYILLSDCLSVLQALQSSNSHSKNIINFLAQEIAKVSNQILSLEFIWVPGHSGIAENEFVDNLARTAKDTKISKWISSHDLLYILKINILTEADTSWKSSKYHHDFSHLNTIKPHYRLLPYDRKMDVLLSRFRTKTHPTNATLFRYNLSLSPLCSTCHQVENIEHILFQSIKYEEQREILRRSLGTIPLSFPWLFDQSDDVKTKTFLVLSFLRHLQL
ncbi:unnamed protein product [Larinioides sclopetarius]|uniref:RNase H type-1 domain-containing protein n=1 Tax=Larinioides sclopetarius TaxID=280406 RepID=A0AAV2BS04_9ARAC